MPDEARVHANLGVALAKAGQGRAALPHLSRALQAELLDDKLRVAIANALVSAGEPGRAMDVLRDAATRFPDSFLIANNLAWHLATQADPALRDPVDAVVYAERAAALTERRDAQVLDTLAETYRVAGRCREAVDVLGEAIEMARQTGSRALATALRTRLAELRCDARP